MSYEDRVYYGAKFLDAVRPNWTDDIDLDRLDLQDGDNCILGQLFDDYSRVGGVTGSTHEWRHWADLGFIRYELDETHGCVYPAGYNSGIYMDGVSRRRMEFAFLENEWRSVILARRASR